jgi:hypothetical protein
VRIALEGRVGNVDIVVAHDAVQQLARALGPEQHGVELDDAMQVVFAQQEVDDALDLVGRAPVERAERERVRQLGLEVEVAKLLVLVGDLLAQSIDDGRRVFHSLDERLHAFGLHAREVVTDAHVEQDRVEAGLHGQTVARVQDLDEHRALDVFLERLLELELLTPLDVEAHGSHVDARARNGQLVEDLNRLELHDPASREPAQDDVLRHLGLRSRGGPEGCSRPAPVQLNRQILVGVAEEALAQWQVEDLLLAL